MDSCIPSSYLSHSSKIADETPKISSVMIRNARSQDLNSLTQLIITSFHRPLEWVTWAYPLVNFVIYEDLRQRITNNCTHYRCFVAYKVNVNLKPQQEEILGTVELSLRPKFFLGSAIPYLANLAVNPPYRRQGIAQKLLLQCEKMVVEWGFQELSLHVLENNYAAKRLYFSHGYRLYRVESSLGSWFFNQPRRLFLSKKLT